MHNMMEIVKNVASVIGCVVSFLGLFALIKTKFLSTLGTYVKKETNTDANDLAHKQMNERIDRIEKVLKDYITSDEDFKQTLRIHIKGQDDACRQLMAGVIEDTYRQHLTDKTLDSVEWKRIVSAYGVYHDELHGNSYISEVYNEMQSWEHAA